MTLQELNRGLQLQQQLQQNQEILESLKAKISPDTCRLNGMPHGTDISDKTAYLAAMIIDMEKSIAEIEKELKVERQKAEEFSDSIPDCTLRTIFKLRFVRGLQWKEVADMMGIFYSKSYARDKVYSYLRKHGNKADEDFGADKIG